MTDLFASPQAMLRQAKKHVADLETEIKTFMRDKPWSKAVELDADGRANTYKIKFTKTLRDDLPNIAFDAANNLRSALDQLAFAIAVQHTGNKNLKSAKFPFGPTETHMRNDAKGGCKDLPTEIVALFEGFKGYKGGNNTLWALNELANTPKHKLLVPVVIGGAAAFAKRIEIDYANGVGVQLLQPRWDRENNEIKYLRAGVNSKFRGNVDVSFSVAFDDVDEVIRGQNPVAVLRAMASEVERVLVATEAECRRIGLIQ